jgi:hypothetical protein
MGKSDLMNVHRRLFLIANTSSFPALPVGSVNMRSSKLRNFLRVLQKSVGLSYQGLSCFSHRFLLSDIMICPQKAWQKPPLSDLTSHVAHSCENGETDSLTKHLMIYTIETGKYPQQFAGYLEGTSARPSSVLKHPICIWPHLAPSGLVAERTKPAASEQGERVISLAIWWVDIK